VDCPSPNSNVDEAIFWFSRAADHGSTDAAKQLAFLYLGDSRRPANPVLADRYAKQADAGTGQWAQIQQQHSDQIIQRAAEAKQAAIDKAVASQRRWDFAAGVATAAAQTTTVMADASAERNAQVQAQRDAQVAAQAAAPAPAKSAFNVNQPRPTSTPTPAKTQTTATPQPGRVASNSGSAAPPVATQAPQSPYVATNTLICPASGFVPGVTKQTGDVAVGLPCTPGQPINSSASTGGTSQSPGYTNTPSNLQICREVTVIVRNTPTMIPDGPFSCPGHMSNQLTNNSINTVTCTWAYLVNGQYTPPGTSSIDSGKTIGGAMQGMDSCNSSGMKYYCFDGKDPNDSHGTSCFANVTFQP
jgi:hypothetical protein